MSAAAPSYEDWLKQDLGAVIDSLSLEDVQRHFLRSRWLDQVLWMEVRAVHALGCIAPSG